MNHGEPQSEEFGCITTRAYRIVYVLALVIVIFRARLSAWYFAIIE